MIIFNLIFKIAIEQQMKKIYDHYEQIYEQIVTMFRKQEKTTDHILSQIKTISEKMEVIVEEKKSEWWEVHTFIRLYRF